MIPDITGLPFDELIDADGDVYMRRYWLRKSRAGELRYHHILKSDQDRDLHDHPWNFITTLLDGCYRETTPNGTTSYQQGDTLHRSAAAPHRLTLPEGPVWTQIRTGPYLKTWGFHTEHGWIDWRKYRDTTPSRDW